MCGIAGLWATEAAVNSADVAASVRRMTRAISHRGPDDEGYFVESAAGLALGHRRLSIVDLSPAGHQPMVSPSGRYVIVFNGEVYNHNRLRPQLEATGFQFRGHSDTEAMLAGIELWGLTSAVGRFVGMFAFALWDRKERRLSLVRDRLGIKPLYFGWTSAGFAFGSELKAIRATPGFKNAICRDSLTLLLRYNYIPAPWSVYEGIYKLGPGTILAIDAGIASTPHSIKEIGSRAISYWSARTAAETGLRNPFSGSAQDAVMELENLLLDAVRLRMEADVPLGAFLSGGVDSSTVVALMQASSQRPIKTFSIGFHEAQFDEAPHAKRVAAHLGTDHTEFYVTPDEALDVIPRLPDMYDEPFSDPSQIPTLLVSRLARRLVTVSLSGDGGDELFGGYDRYLWLRRLWSRLAPIPSTLRQTGAGVLEAAPRMWGGALQMLMPLLPRHLRVANPREKIPRLAEVLRMESPEALYFQLVSHWGDPAAIVIGGQEPVTALSGDNQWPEGFDHTHRMMCLDLITYLPDDILAKVDRASMAVSLEARVPLLDHRVVEFAWRLPLRLKINGDVSKWALRQVLYQRVPRTLIERPKQGFGIPLGDWLRGPLREWAEELLDPRRLEQEGYLNPEPIRTMWLDHRDKRRDEQYRLWDVLMFQSWLMKHSEPQALDDQVSSISSKRDVLIAED